jgi:hypothetical protein
MRGGHVWPPGDECWGKEGVSLGLAEAHLRKGEGRHVGVESGPRGPTKQRDLLLSKGEGQ